MYWLQHDFDFLAIFLLEWLFSNIINLGMDLLNSACSKDNKITTCLKSTCSGQAVKAGVSNSALPTLDKSV